MQCPKGPSGDAIKVRPSVAEILSAHVTLERDGIPQATLQTAATGNDSAIFEAVLNTIPTLPAAACINPPKPLAHSADVAQ